MSWISFFAPNLPLQKFGGGTPSRDTAWGLVLAGVHHSPYSDVAITTTSEAVALRNHMLGMQSGPSYAKEVPVFWTGIYGDFDGDFQPTAQDIDLLNRHQHFYLGKGYNWYLDWQHDTSNGRDVDWYDVKALVEDPDVFNTRVGDLNLDGDVDESDRSGLESYIGATYTSWVFGDLNGDGTTTSSDMNLLMQNFGWVRP